MPISAIGQTDVIVFDQKGRFAEGIPREQFEVLLDGRTQSITYLESVAAGSPEEEIQWAGARGEATAISSRERADGAVAGRAVLFFVDDLHMSVPSVAAVREQLTRYIDTKMGPGDRAVIVAASKRVGILQQLSSDKTVLRSAAAQLSSVPTSIQDHVSPPMSDAQAMAIEDDDEATLAPFVKAALELQRVKGKEGRRRAERNVRSRASALAAGFAKVSESMLSFLTVSLRCFSEEPGRKVAFFLSDGFYLRDRHSDSVGLILRATDIAARGRIAVYTLDARNLASASSGAAATPGPATQPGAGKTGDSPALAGGLGLLAVDTGGRFLRGSASLVDAVAATLAENSRYYLIGWSFNPAIVRSGNSRALKILVKGRPDLRVQVRQSSVDLARFLAPGAAAGGDASADPLLDAIRAPKPISELPIYLYCGYALSADRIPLLTISLQSTQEFAEAGAWQKPGDVAMESAGAVISESGLTADSFRGTLSYTDDPKSLPSTKQIELTFTRSVPVTPGAYQVRVSGRNPRSGRIGSAFEQCEVPQFSADSISLSSIFLVFPPNKGPLPYNMGSQPTANSRVNARRRFAPGSSLTYLFFLYTPQPVTDSLTSRISVQSKVYSGETEVVRQTPKQAAEAVKTGSTAVRYAAQLILAGLTAGSYTLEVTAVDNSTNQSAKQRVSFWIE